MQSCDTLVINKSCSVYGQNILAKNSDRPTGEPQPLCYYEGKEYPKEAIQTLLATGITPSMLRASVGFFEGSSEPIRSPVAYLAKCIFGMLVNGECPTVSSGKSATSLGSASANLSGGASAENTVSAKPKREESITSFGSLDVDDFFSAALKRTYGDMEL